MFLTIGTDCNDKSGYGCKGDGTNSYYGVTYAVGEQAKEPIFADSWISPSGKQYIVGMCGHQHSAQWHSNWVKPTDEQRIADSSLPAWPADAFERNGWIHYGLDYRSPIVEYNYPVTPTQAQLDTLFDILIQGKQSLDSSWYVCDDGQVDALDTFIRTRQAR